MAHECAVRERPNERASSIYAGRVALPLRRDHPRISPVCSARGAHLPSLARSIVSRRRIQQVDGDAVGGGQPGNQLRAGAGGPALKLAQGGLRNAGDFGSSGLGHPGRGARQAKIATEEGVEVHEPNISDTDFVGQADTVDSRIGRRVKAMRKASGVRQVDLALALGLTQGRLSQMENGEPWSAFHVWTAASALGCRPSDLMDDVPKSQVESSVVEALRADDYMTAMALLLEAMKRTRP